MRHKNERFLRLSRTSRAIFPLDPVVFLKEPEAASKIGVNRWFHHWHVRWIVYAVLEVRVPRFGVAQGLDLQNLQWL